MEIFTITTRPSRSLNVIGTDTDRSAIGDFLLAFQIVLSRTVSEINGDICKIFHPVFNAPLRGFLGVCNGGGAGKLE